MSPFTPNNVKVRIDNSVEKIENTMFVKLLSTCLKNIKKNLDIHILVVYNKSQKKRATQQMFVRESSVR